MGLDLATAHQERIFEEVHKKRNQTLESYNHLMEQNQLSQKEIDKCEGSLHKHKVEFESLENDL